VKGHRGKVVLGLVISVLLLAWAVRDVSASRVLTLVSQADVGWLVLMVVAATAAFPLRALRWRVLLLPEYPDTSLRGRFAAVCVGFMANNVFPVRLGEFARAFALSRVEPVEAGAAFGSLVMERVLDGLTLTGLLVVVLLLPGGARPGILDVPLLARIALGAAVVFGIGFVGIWIVVRFPGLAVRLFEATLGRVVPDRFYQRLRSILRTFVRGLRIVGSPGILIRALAWSLAVWLCLSSSIWCGMRAFGIDGPGFTGAVLVQALVGFAVAIPSSPGFFGPLEAAARIGLSAYGVRATPIIAFATSYHILTFIPITLLGLWYLYRLGLGWRDVERSEELVEASVEGAAGGASGPDAGVARSRGGA
jgi:uncharacterized protein (TIRG00374 family)